MADRGKTSLESIFTLAERNWPRRLARVMQRRDAERNFLFAISMVCTLGGLLFGYNTGVTNGAISFIEHDLGLSSVAVGSVTGSLLIGAAFGAFLGGQLSDWLGRRRVTLINSVNFILGTLVSSLASNLIVMLVGRVLLGLAVGCASATVPVFLAELAPSEKRGQMVSRNELMLVTGQLIAFLSNAILGTLWADSPQIWRLMLVLGILPSLGLLLGTWLVVPESPRWLISKGRNEQAIGVLKRIRTSELQARAELEEVRHLVEEDRKVHEDVSFRELVSESWVRRCIAVGLGVALCQQITGVNSIMFYGTEILKDTGLTPKAALVANIANGLISVLATFVGIWLLGRTARRRMLMTAQAGTIVVHLLIGLCELLVPNGLSRGLLVLALCVVFLSFQQGSISPVTWLLLSEIFPLRIRGLAISLTTFVLWLANTLVAVLFPILTDLFPISYIFFAFSAFNILALLFSWRWLPETRGKSLEEVEQQFKCLDWAKLRQDGNFCPEEDTDEGHSNHSSVVECQQKQQHQQGR